MEAEPDWEELPEMPQVKLEPDEGVPMQVSELTRWLDTDNFKQFTLEDLGGWPSVEAPLEQIQMPIGKPFIAHYLQNVSASMRMLNEMRHMHMSPVLYPITIISTQGLS